MSISWSAPGIAVAADSSAPATSPRPSQRAPASAARSVANAKPSQLQTVSAALMGCPSAHERVEGARGNRAVPPLHQKGTWGKHGFPHGSEPKASDAHARTSDCARSTSCRTRRMTSSTASSMRVFSITGTPARCARSTRYPGSAVCRGASAGTSPSAAARSRPLARPEVTCVLLLVGDREQALADDRSLAGLSDEPGTRCTPSTTIEIPPRARARSAPEPTDTLRVCSRKPSSAGSPSSGAGAPRQPSRPRSSSSGSRA